MAKISAMDIYKLLPKTNCKKCGESSCMAFATKLQNKKVMVETCPIMNAPKFEEKKKQLIELLSPPVKEVWFGNNTKKAKLGGDEVMYRYELTYYNPSPFGIEISDNLSNEEIIEKAKSIENFVFERTGEELKLDFIALRNTSNNADKFKNAIKLIEENTKMPLALCSLNPDNILEGLKVIKSKPLIYVATEDNFSKMLSTLINYKKDKSIKKSNKDFALVVSSKDIKILKGMTKKCLELGIEDLVLDPYTHPENISETLDKFVMIRRAAIENGDKLLGFPLLGLPINTYYYTLNNNPISSFIEDNDKAAKVMEARTADVLLLRYADALIFYGMDMWELMAVLTVRQAIYTDPRKPQAVEPDVYKIGNPDENSPVIMTTNFALTYYTVVGDFEKDGVNCWLVVLDTEGKAVDVAVAGGQYNGENAKNLLEEKGLKDLVNHRAIILPGLAAPARGDIEEKTGWTCVVGTRDSSQVGDFLKKNWESILEKNKV